MSQQNQQPSYMRIVPADRQETGTGMETNTATNGEESQTIDLMAAYRMSRISSQQSFRTSSGFRSSGAGYFRRAA
ncbi:MAG: hypothetical protein QM754_08525 [Tepidisphaeraceae bacterium]